MTKIKTKIDLFKAIISNKHYFFQFTKGDLIYKILNDKNYKKIQKTLNDMHFKDFGSKQEIIEFLVILFLYKNNFEIKKIVDNSLKENKLIFSKYNHKNSPDLKIGKYWYEITTILSDNNAYESDKKFLIEKYKMINKNTKFIHTKKQKGFIDFEGNIDYFIEEIYKAISKKIDKEYEENGKKFKIKRLIIHKAFNNIQISSSIMFLEFLIKKYGEKIYKKIKNNVKIYISFSKPNKEDIKIVVAEYSDKNPKKIQDDKFEEDIIIEINQNFKKVYENNKLKYKNQFFQIDYV